MEAVSCYNCGVADATEYAVENGFSLKKCGRCGLLYVSPRPGTDEILEAHRHGQHRGEKAVETTGYHDFSKVSSYVRTLTDLFGDGRELHGKSWLDIGCGFGEFVQALKVFTGNRVHVKGLEPNVFKAEAARGKGLDVSDFDLATHAQRYDYLSILNVYSHLPDPPNAIAGWKRLLEPGGHIVIETGDTADFPPEQHPRPFYLPDHLSFASERIVRGMLEKLGFEIVSVHKYREVRETPLAAVREVLKLFVPGKHSRIGRMLKGELKSIDMYVHARFERAPS